MNLDQLTHFQILLRFMYSGRVDVDGINPAKIMKLLTAADLYQVTRLDNIYEVFPSFLKFGIAGLGCWFFEMKLLCSLYNIFFFLYY